MASSSYMKLLSKTMQGSDDIDEVNESEEFDCKHYLVGSFCYTGVSGSCVILSLVRSASHLIPDGICPGYLFPLFRFFRHCQRCFGLLIIRITSQKNENSGNWDETLLILQ